MNEISFDSPAMQLNASEIEQVNGGILPIIAAAVGLDAALTGFMISAGYW
ncbi:class IIb bacteriocin, lactobin A/cerein 7B family [Alteromonas pelagimontana]|uniref:Class IIb bacteriocin, lactobin A/cerein 7B family n=1 Tax=Alteromonas pelagimontana TaxID=1858656 RepID=A0A6M4MH87_9ALTE|nr:class IIb bacteriocin, lactobin A/cerein 7B family [Alteromonas pelagimontana]QJR82402.1 class IIb bacteriocin, lactobin A/cerein 7B family [Alteromonas pelagimontana]